MICMRLVNGGKGNVGESKFLLLTVLEIRTESWEIKTRDINRHLYELAMYIKIQDFKLRLIP
jgi:hypothetical protein